jgi:hypothetical protein
MSPLWMSIEPRATETRLMLTQPRVGTSLRARLPVVPVQPEALGLLLRGLVAWYGQPFCAVLDAAAEDVQRQPERWAQFLGDIESALVRVEWVAHQVADEPRDRFLGTLGDFSHARRLITFAATGQR